jgi:hypothetical protein
MRQGGGIIFKGQNIHILHGHSDHWRWDHCAVSKFWAPITNDRVPHPRRTHSSTLPNKKPQNQTTYTVIMLPYSYWLPFAVRIVTNKAHSAEGPHTWHSSSRTWQTVVVGHKRDILRFSTLKRVTLYVHCWNILCSDMSWLMRYTFVITTVYIWFERTYYTFDFYFSNWNYVYIRRVSGKWIF